MSYEEGTRKKYIFCSTPHVKHVASTLTYRHVCISTKTIAYLYAQTVARHYARVDINIFYIYSPFVFKFGR